KHRIDLMKPFEPRLLRHARAARGVLLAGAGLSVLRTLAIVAWCWVLAQALSIAVLPVLGGLGSGSGEVAEHVLAPESFRVLVAVGAAALVVRSASGWGIDAVAARGAARVKSQLRAAALDALDSRSPLRADPRSDAEIVTVL